MAKIILYRRKRQGRTDYRKRLNLLKSNKLRLVVRKSNKNMILQLVKYHSTGDKVIASSHTKELSNYGWNISLRNLPASYLVGYLLGIKAKGKEAVLDIGLQSPQPATRIYAALKGAIDGGLLVKASEGIFPSEERIQGKHIKAEELFQKGKASYR